MGVPSGTYTLPSRRRGHRVRVTTRVDKFGEDTSWVIRNGGDVVVRMGPIVPSNSVRAFEDCLPAGDYDFKISNFDGICCKQGNGGYALVVDGVELLDGGTFTTLETHAFRIGHDWVSGMSDRACEWWWGHHVRQQDWHMRCYAKYCVRDYRHLKWSALLEADARDYSKRLLVMCKETGIQHDDTDQGKNLSKNQGGGVLRGNVRRQAPDGAFCGQQGILGMEQECPPHAGAKVLDEVPRVRQQCKEHGRRRDLPDAGLPVHQG